MSPPRAFPTPKHLTGWLAKHHASETELWVQIFKKDSGTPSVDWQDCVVAAIAWGWIDGQKRSLDAASFLQRLTPRRTKSNWSKKNCEHAERLIAAGEMQPVGLAHVEAARADGRWDAAYAGQSEMVLPADFLAALEADAAAKAGFLALGKTGQFAVYYRLHTAKRAETRAKRMAVMLARLARGEGV
jgi:uncharacterized protein YdeI (YjbR/CyaY-like superfamily)